MKTAPGALVYVNGRQAKVERDGRFSSRVPLKLGKNKIILVTEDVSGRRKERTFPCITVDPSKKIEKINIDWGAPH